MDSCDWKATGHALSDFEISDASSLSGQAVVATPIGKFILTKWTMRPISCEFYSLHPFIFGNLIRLSVVYCLVLGLGFSASRRSAVPFVICRASSTSPCSTQESAHASKVA